MNLSVTEVYGNPPTDTEVLRSFVPYSEEYNLENWRRASVNCSLLSHFGEGELFEIHLQTEFNDQYHLDVVTNQEAKTD